MFGLIPSNRKQSTGSDWCLSSTTSNLRSERVLRAKVCFNPRTLISRKRVDLGRREVASLTESSLYRRASGPTTNTFSQQLLRNSLAKGLSVYSTVITKTVAPMPQPRSITSKASQTTMTGQTLRRRRKPATMIARILTLIRASFNQVVERVSCQSRLNC